MSVAEVSPNLDMPRCQAFAPRQQIRTRGVRLLSLLAVGIPAEQHLQFNIVNSIVGQDGLDDLRRIDTAPMLEVLVAEANPRISVLASRLNPITKIEGTDLRSAQELKCTVACNRKKACENL